MTFDSILHVRILLRSLTFLGLWPGKSGYAFLRYYRYVLHTVTTLLMTLLMWTDVFTSTDFAHVSDVLYISLTESALIVKIFNNFRGIQTIVQLIDEWATNPQFQLKTPEERHIWERKTKVFGWIYKFYMGCSIIIIPITFISALFNFPNELAFPYWVPFNWHDSHKFWYAYGYNLLSIAVTCYSNINMDMLNCYIMLHLGLSLRVLGMRLAKLKQAPGENGEQQMYLQLTGFIEWHKRIKWQANQVQGYLSPGTSVQILLSSLVLCFAIYRLQELDIAKNPGTCTGMIQYVTSMILQIYLPSHYGNEMTYYSTALVNDIYSADWPNMSRRNRRLVLMFITYLNEPIYIRASGFFTIGLPLFTKVMNQAYSLLALLLNVND